MPRGLSGILERGSAGRVHPVGLRETFRKMQPRTKRKTAGGGNRSKRPQHFYAIQRFSDALHQSWPDRMSYSPPIETMWADYLKTLKGEAKKGARALSSRQAHGFWQFMLDHADTYGMDRWTVRRAYKGMFPKTHKLGNDASADGSANDNQPGNPGKRR